MRACCPEDSNTDTNHRHGVSAPCSARINVHIFDTGTREQAHGSSDLMLQRKGDGHFADDAILAKYAA